MNKYLLNSFYKLLIFFLTKGANISLFMVEILTKWISICNIYYKTVTTIYIYIYTHTHTYIYIYIYINPLLSDPSGREGCETKSIFK